MAKWTITAIYGDADQRQTYGPKVLNGTSQEDVERKLAQHPGYIAGSGPTQVPDTPTGGGSSGAGASAVAATGTKELGKGFDLAGKAIEIIGATVDYAKNAYAAMENSFQQIDDSGILDPLTAMQDAFGMSNEAYEDFDAVSNKFVKSELDKFMALDDAYIKSTEAKSSLLFDHFEHGEMKEAYKTLLGDMNNMNAMALESFSVQERERALLVQKNLKLTSQETTKLLQRTYAYSGDTSSDILTNIAAVSDKLSKAAGISQKDLANEMAQILADTETFGNMSEEQAGKMAAAYKQLGLDLNAVKGIINGFRSFDQAAQKMGDLSAMFGIQMDAMEMMALANEDEEAFLTKMRDDMMDQGVDVENMSKTRLRALGDQLNMTQEQVQTFFRTGEMQADQAALDEAAAEAASETVEETVQNVKDLRREIKRSQKEIIALGSAKSMINLRQEFAQTARKGDRLNIAIAKAVPASETAEAGMRLMLTNVGGLVDEFRAKVSGGGESEGNFFGDVLGLTDADMMGNFKDAAMTQAEGAGVAVGETFANKLAEPLCPDSLPPAWEPLATGLKWIKDNASGNNKFGVSEAGTAVGSAFMTGIEDEIALGMDNIQKMITDSINKAGPLDVEIKADVIAQLSSAAELKADTTEVQIDTSGLAEQLSGLGFKEASEAISKFPEDIKTALASLTVENQEASKIEAAAFTAETLSVENSPAFKALEEALSKMSDDQKTELGKISKGLTDGKVISVNLMLNEKTLAHAMRDYDFDSGETFAMNIG